MLGCSFPSFYLGKDLFQFFSDKEISTYGLVNFQGEMWELVKIQAYLTVKNLNIFNFNIKNDWLNQDHISDEIVKVNG